MPRRPPRDRRPPGSPPSSSGAGAGDLAWGAVAAGVVVLGVGLAVLVLSFPRLVFLAVLGVGAGWTWSRVGTRWPVRWGLATLVLPLAGTALVGWAVVGGAAAAVSAGGVVAVAMAQGGRSRARTGHPGSAPPHPRPAAEPVPPAARVAAGDLGGLTDAHLCRVWRQTHAEVTVSRGHSALGALADSRRAVLDEMERRHPVGFAAWLSSGARAGGNPEPYLQHHRDR